jgi:hypothetical protein
MWQWKITLCDDNSDQQSIIDTKTEFEKVGCCVKIISTIKEFMDDDNIKYLSECHIVLMDMKWTNIGSIKENPTWIPDSGEFCNKKIENAKQWIKAINYWCISNINRRPRDSQWPCVQIAENEVGVWLAALISHLSNNAQIVLYSSLSGIFNSGFAAGLGRFRKPFYKVITKPEEIVLTPNNTDILQCLVILQHEYLKNIKIYEWFLESVFFRLLLDKDPCAEIIELFDGNQKVSITMSASNYFPQLIDCNRTEQVNKLLEFVTPTLLTDDIKIILNKVKHDLYDEKLLSYNSENYKNLACSVAGAFPFGELPASLLFKAAQEEQYRAIGYAKKAKEIIIEQHDETPIRWLYRTWIKEINGISNRILGFCEGELLEKDIKIRNFNISAFNNILSALEDNSKRYGKNYKVNCIKSHNNIIIQYCSFWDNITIDNFYNSVIESIKKRKEAGGWTRGLPVAIHSSLRFGVKYLSVYIINNWHSIYKNTEESIDMGENIGDFNFAISWCFPVII